MNEIRLKTKSNKVEDNGIVTVAVAAFGNEDSQMDISMPGSFGKTLKENRRRFKHFLNHNQDFLIGCPLDAWEDKEHLVFKSEMNLDTELGRDVYSNYKLYQKNGLTLEHSIGVEDVKRDPFDRRKVLEWRLWEFSTLYSWGANERTPLLDLKQLDFSCNPNLAIKYINDALRLRYTDEKLAQYENYLHLLEKAMEGSAGLVACDCGLKFDYGSVPEETLEKQVLEVARDMVRWRANGAVEMEIAKLDPQIREHVSELISKGLDLERLTSFVYCPRCGRRLYRSDIIEAGGTASKMRTTVTKGLNLGAIGALIKG